MDLHGRNVVYVGGFSGVGFAACKELMGKDIASLVILDIRERTDLLGLLGPLNRSVDLIYIKLDLCNRESIKKSLRETVDRIKYIDVLINGGGVTSELNIELTVELTVSINLIGLINTTLAAVPYMDKSIGGRGGVIVNVASLLGLQEPRVQNSVYSASNHGVVGFTKSFAEDHNYQRTGVMMMIFCQGLTVTSLVECTNWIFPFSIDLQTKRENKSQTADECGIGLVKAIECGRNGIVWKFDAGHLGELDLFKH